MTDRELLEQALEALEEFCDHQTMLRPIEKRDALRERLAQPEQEPVAWVAYENGEKHGIDFDEDEIADLPVGTMLYTAPPEQEPEGRRRWCMTYNGHQDGCPEAPQRQAQPEREWQGLFFDAVYEAWHSAGMDVLGGDWNTFASTLEAKLKEKIFEKY